MAHSVSIPADRRSVPVRRMPVLDVGPLLAGDRDGTRRAAAKLRETFETVGFNSIVNHGIPADLIARMTEQSRRFHALPMERKLAYKVDQNQRGYIPPKGSMIKVSTYNRNTRFDTGGVMVVATEYADDHPQVKVGKRFYSRNRWPVELPAFRATAEEYLAAMNALGHRMMTLWALALDLPEDFFAPHFAEPYSYMRLSHYAAQEELAENEFGQSPHADAGLQTFLAPTSEPGLQILDTDGTWFAPAVEDGALIHNAGLIFERWTNKRFRATPHRVVPPQENDRFSVACFVNTDLAAVCAPIATCVGPDNPPRYPTQTYWEFYNWYMSSIYSHYPEFEAAE